MPSGSAHDVGMGQDRIPGAALGVGPDDDLPARVDGDRFRDQFGQPPGVLVEALVGFAVGLESADAPGGPVDDAAGRVFGEGGRRMKDRGRAVRAEARVEGAVGLTPLDRAGGCFAVGFGALADQEPTIGRRGDRPKP